MTSISMDDSDWLFVLYRMFVLVRPICVFISPSDNVGVGHLLDLFKLGHDFVLLAILTKRREEEEEEEEEEEKNNV
jgi:hypothetical protein